MSKPSLIGLSKEQLAEIFAKYGMEKFRAKQVWHWIYNKGVTDFEQMSNIAKPTREKLASLFDLSRPEITKTLSSQDGSQKWLIKFEDGNEIEAVYMPDEDRGTLCISSQIGCTNTCRFCNTGSQMLVRNLNAREIVSQVMITRDYLGEWAIPPNAVRKLSNIVIMGMGEPLFNYNNVSQAVKIITDCDGIAISKRRVTLSTAGVVPFIEKCGEDLGINLAVSLHATNDKVRDEIMPINKKYPIAELLAACRKYGELSNKKRITFEYVMLKGINDSVADAHELVRLIKGIPAKINVIPFNPWEGCDYECSSNNTIHKFLKVLRNSGYAAPIRKSRGDDIMAACGQLKSDSVRQENQTEETGNA